MRLAAATVAASLAAGPLAACTPVDPPAPGGSPSVALPEVDPSLRTLASASAPVSTPAGSTTPSADPALLPQTHDLPRAAGPAFESRAMALWDAIVKDDPGLGMVFFFPQAAYEQVKDVGEPAADWKHRLVEAYARDIHSLHTRLAQGGASARMVALDVPEGRARWVEPGEEYNKIGYFRVFGSKLRYELADASRSFDVKSLISWRGEWYVVHLSAIR